MDFISELSWRGMINDMTPGTTEKLQSGMVCGYIGFDPTAPSLQVGNLAAIMLLVHFQRCGHKPLALVGGATGMIGDPSGKSEERSLISQDDVLHNLERFKVQLRKFLDFDSPVNGAEIVNNYDWFKNMGFLEFLRDVGKHLTVSYMIAKDSVQSRLENGISFTEFSYQLLQGYDFLWLLQNKNCEFQMGGSDQWGNITAGTELIRRKSGADAFALTTPLVTRSDGTKFGKSAAGEKLWLDPAMTSPYKFYQFWLNVSDDEARRFIRVFTLLLKDDIETLEREHALQPHLRLLQKALARDITVRVHSQSDYDSAVAASDILFGSGTAEALRQLPEASLLAALEGVPRASVAHSLFDQGVALIELLAGHTQIFSSKGEARRMISGGGVCLNKLKTASIEDSIKTDSLIQGKYLLVQKGKKNYHLIVAEQG